MGTPLKVIEMQETIDISRTNKERFILNVFFQNGNSTNNSVFLSISGFSSGTAVLTDFSSPAYGGNLTSWPSGTVVTFVYNYYITPDTNTETSAFFITNWRPIANISGMLESYVSKSGFKVAAENSTQGLITDNKTDPIPETAHIVTRGVSAFYTRPINQLIPYVHQEARVGYNGAYKADGTGENTKDPMIDFGNDDYNWFLVAETRINQSDFGQGVHQDREIIFYVHDTQTETHRGILKARIRNYELGSVPNLSLNWDYSKVFNLTDFVLITNGNSPTYNGGAENATEADINITCQLYTRVSTNWQARIFNVISQGTRSSKYNNNVWKLYDWFGTPSASHQEQYRFSSPEEGFRKTVLNNGATIELKSIISNSLQYVISNSYADLTQVDNGVSADEWGYSILFKDKHDLGHYGRIIAPIYASGAVGLVLNASNYAAGQTITDSNVRVSAVDIGLYAYKDASAKIRLITPTTTNSIIEMVTNTLSISAQNCRITNFPSTSEIRCIGNNTNKTEIYLWSASDSYIESSGNLAGLWIKDTINNTSSNYTGVITIDRDKNATFYGNAIKATSTDYAININSTNHYIDFDYDRSAGYNPTPWSCAWVNALDNGNGGRRIGAVESWKMLANSMIKNYRYATQLVGIPIYIRAGTRGDYANFDPIPHFNNATMTLIITTTGMGLYFGNYNPNSDNPNDATGVFLWEINNNGFTLHTDIVDEYGVPVAPKYRGQVRQSN